MDKEFNSMFVGKYMRTNSKNFDLADNQIDLDRILDQNQNPSGTIV